MRENWELIKKDVKKTAFPGILLLIYYGVMRTVFHGTCFMVRITGFPCPACGLTRAFKLLLHGKFREAYDMHPFIYVWILVALLFLVYRYLFMKPVRNLYYVAGAALALMVVYYIYRMIRYFPGDPPMSYDTNHLLHRLLSLQMDWKT